MNFTRRRGSLGDQVAGFLIKCINEKVWVKQLPGERVLCARLGVSRSTFRLAMAALQSEGWIARTQGKPSRILPHRATGAKDTAVREVGILIPLPLQALPAVSRFWIEELRVQLAEARCHLEIHCGPRFYSQHPSRALDDLVSSRPAVGWILFATPLAVQRWFCERGLRALVAGPRHAGIALPAVGVDFRAACRHGAELLLARGHRTIALLIQETGRAADLQSVEGFSEAFQESNYRGTCPLVVHHDGTRPHICTQLDRLLDRSQRPTALFVAYANCALAVVTHLLSRRIEVPRQMALISREDDPLLEYVTPEVARYSYDPTLVSRKISRAVLRLIRGERLPQRPILIFPDFIKGDTL